MNKYDLGKQKTLAELCVKKDEELKEAKQEIAELKASLPKVRADAVSKLMAEETTTGRLRDDTKRSFIFVSDAVKFIIKLEQGE